MSRSRATPKERDRARRIPDLGRFLSDFRTGLGKLKELTQRLAPQPAKELRPAATTSLATERREIMRTLERELQLIERVAPPELRERVVTEFRSKAEAAIQMGIPQAYAQLAAAANVVPATAIRPQQVPAVRSVLAAAKAIRSGRLAFLPRRTRVEARKLLQAIFSAPKAVHPLRGAPMAAAVTQQRLIPSVVQGMMRSYDSPEQSKTYIDIIEAARQQQLDPDSPEARISAPMSSSAATARAAASFDAPHQDDIRLDAPLPGAGAAAPSSPSPAPPTGLPSLKPLAPQATAQLSKAIPAFQSTGIATDAAPTEVAMSYDPASEGAIAIGKNSDLTTAADIRPEAPGSASVASARRTNETFGSGKRLAAPTSESTNTAARNGGAGAGSDSGSGRPVTVTGSLTIAGLPDFIAKTEMRLQGLESIARTQNG